MTIATLGSSGKDGSHSTSCEIKRGGRFAPFDQANVRLQEVEVRCLGLLGVEGDHLAAQATAGALEDDCRLVVLPHGVGSCRRS